MKSKITSGRLALVVALMALVAALSGTAYAVTADSTTPARAADIGKIVQKTKLSAQTTDADGTTNGGDAGIAKVKVGCPAGSKVIGGGADWVGFTGISRHFYLQESRRAKNGWFARGVVDFGAQGDVQLRVYAYCLK